MASRNIKGITIEIDGNTSKLQDSLKKVDKSLKDTQSNLKDIDKLLKLDPGNTELLKQKFDNLNKAVEQTEERLKTLKSAQKEGMDPEQAAALQREIIATEQQLESLKGQQKEFGSVSKQEWKAAGDKISSVGSAISAVGDKITEAGDKVKGFGESVTKNLSGPMAALGALSIKAFGDVDEGMDIVVKKTGATGEALDGMQTAVKNIATSIPTDFATAGNAVGEVNTRFGLMGDELQNVSEAYIKFAQLNGVDVVQAIDSSQSAMTAWGFAAEDAGDFLDLLNKVGQDTGVSVTQLSDQLKTNAASLQDAGFNALDAANFLGNLEKNGIDTATALKGLQKAQQLATSENKTSSQVLQELQTNIQNAKTDQEAFAAASEVFGNKAGPALALALQEDRLSFEDLGTSWDSVAGNVGTTFQNTLDPVDSLQTTMNSVKELLAEVGGVIQEIAVPALEKLREVVEWLKEKWEGLDSDQQNTIVTIGLVIAAIGPAIMIIGQVISVVGTLVSGIGSVISVIGSVVGVLGGPLTLAIGAIIAVIAVLIANWDKVKETAARVRDFVVNAWTNLKEKVTGAVQAVKDKVTGVWDTIKTKTSTAWQRIKEAVISPITKAKEKVHEIIEKIKGFFHFDWSLPKLKMPHVSIQGEFSLIPPKVPKFSIEWYKKAYDNPVMFTSPTVMATQSGLKGFGDGAGAEIVMGLNKLRELVGSGGGNTINVYASPGMNVQQLAEEVSRAMTRAEKQRRAAI